MNGTQSKSGVNEALDRARACSPFLRQQILAQPAVAAALAAGSVVEALAAARLQAGTVDNIMSAVRRERSGIALALGIGDLAGALSLEEVVETLSAIADAALDRAVAAAIAERTPGEEARGFAVIALGKLGSRELNYSSDVDVLFLFDPARLPLRPREDAGEAAVRIGKRVVEILQKRTDEGYAFRVDL
ncbi:MAG TPA: DUF294 nucleotidyltransferase-like domain-containing protein, partial [Allosphingosinicella sp.]